MAVETGEEPCIVTLSFRDEGKPSLTVAVGCTGGRHRSVSVARALTDHLLKKGQNARLICRDMGEVNDRG